MHCSKKAKQQQINNETFQFLVESLFHLVTLFKHPPSPKDNLYAFNKKIERISYYIL